MQSSVRICKLSVVPICYQKYRQNQKCQVFHPAFPGKCKCMLLRQATGLTEHIGTEIIKADLSLFLKLHRNQVDTDIMEVFTYRKKWYFKGRSSQLYVEFSCTERRQSFYCNHIVSNWNTLPQGVVNCSTMPLQSLTFTGRGSICSTV